MSEACSLLSVMTEQLHRESQYLDKKGVLGMKYPLLKAGALSNPGYSRQLFAAIPVFRFGDVVFAGVEFVDFVFVVAFANFTFGGVVFVAGT